MHRTGAGLQPREHEEGYILAGVVILLAVFMIVISVAVPKMREDIRRDQEVETIRRGQQYVRALQLYYRRFHHYPASIDDLEDTNGLRFLRRRYEDPLTRSNDWEPVYLGQNKAPLTMGFFGSVLNAGAAIPSSSDQARNSILGAPPDSAFDSFASDASSSPQDAPSGPAFGGGPVIGVRPAKAVRSILVYKTKSNYDEWEFVYDPKTDPSVPKWTVETPYFGAPGMPPPNNP